MGLLSALGLGLSALGTGYNLYSQSKAADEQERASKKEAARLEREEKRAAMARALGGGGPETMPSKPTLAPESRALEQGVSGAIAGLGSNMAARPDEYEALLRRLAAISGKGDTQNAGDVAGFPNIA